jgi:hypothetical protein
MGDSSRYLRRILVCVLAAAAASGTVVRVSPADGPPAAARGGEDDGAGALNELETSTDFRVRVSAALIVGRTRPSGARQALERALLGDSHSAVRVAAAAALGSLGEAAALPALERRLSSDPSGSVQAQIRATIDRLRAAPEPRNAAPDPSPTDLGPDVRYVVRLGTMRNRTGVRGDEVRRALLDSARVRARALRGAAVVEGDGPLLRLAADRRVPVIALDGNVTQIVESRAAGSLQVQARVEFTVRHDQTLKGTLSGGATTVASGPAFSEQSRRQLQDEAIDGAVQSALRGAEQGLIVAAR